VNDVKYLCEKLLDDSAPPPRTGAEMLAAARRSTARRNGLMATGGLAAVAVATVVALAVVPVITAKSTTTTAQLAAPAGPSTPPPNVQPAAPVPFARAAGTHDRKMFNAIKGALPAGFTARPEYRLSTSSTPYPADPSKPLPGGSKALVAANVAVLATLDGRTGWISASIVNDGQPVPTGDLCSAANLKRGHQDGLPCKTFTVNGVPIQVVKEHWDNTAPEIDVYVATRYLRNGSLSVVMSRSVPDFGSEKDSLPPDAVNKHPQKQTPISALGDWFLTEQQLAQLTAGPAMLP